MECANLAKHNAGFLRDGVAVEAFFHARGSGVRGGGARLFGVGRNVLVDTVGGGGIVGNLQGRQIGTAIIAVPGRCVQGQISGDRGGVWASREEMRSVAIAQRVTSYKAGRTPPAEARNREHAGG